MNKYAQMPRWGGIKEQDRRFRQLGRDVGRSLDRLMKALASVFAVLIALCGPAFAQAPTATQQVPTELRASQVCNDSRPASGAAGSATLTPPASQFLYVNSIEINGAASAALASFGTPASATTTNLPGTITSAVFPIVGQAAGVSLGNFFYAYSGNGLKSSAPGTATTVTTPATTGVLWHISLCGYFAP